jgi:hypothetical protein
MCAKAGGVKVRNNVSRETSRLRSPAFHVSQADELVSRESLADTELGKYDIQEVFNVDRAGDSSD